MNAARIELTHPALVTGDDDHLACKISHVRASLSEYYNNAMIRHFLRQSVDAFYRSGVQDLREDGWGFALAHGLY